MRFTNLDMAALRSFVTGVETQSFTLAAQRLGRSTSAVSAQLKKLEDQVGVRLMNKAGRGLALTESGEILLSYGRRLLELNDEAMSAMLAPELEGWVRLGMQEDFGETLLPKVLGQFARAHPKVRVEGRIARNKELLEKVSTGQLDLALAWDDRSISPDSEKLADVQLCWLGAKNGIDLWLENQDAPLPLITLDKPCRLRSIACEALDRQGIAWRIAFVSPSLAGIWAATEAGLGIALRTEVGIPTSVQVLNPVIHHLPALSTLGLMLHQSQGGAQPVSGHLASILKQALLETLPMMDINGSVG